MKKLSILICSLEKREESLKHVLKVIDKQKTEDVEILLAIDNGEQTVGHKRNSLIAKASGEYIAFVDDDDLISNDYIPLVLEAIDKSKPDIIGIEGIIKLKDTEFFFKHSIQYAGWYTGHDAFYRTPNHLNPIKIEIAKMVMFNPSMNAGEDQDYSMRLEPYLETEEYIGKPIYYYNTSMDSLSQYEEGVAAK